MKIEEKSVNELRVLSNEMITNAKSGHPGIALSSAPIVYSLYANVMAFDPQKPNYFNRDRFVLSAGHGSSILYATLHAMGFDIGTDDLKNFRQLGSITPGHPEVYKTSGIDASTGPLGQGVANAVGMAIAEKYLASTFNKKDCKILDNKIFCMTGDGCLMEGISYEALSIAGNLCLDNFVLIYDCNNITIEGSTDITFTEDITRRFEALNFSVLTVRNGNNVAEITKVLQKAKKQTKPTIVVVKTTIGYGTDLAGNPKIHGTPLTLEQLEKLKIALFVSKPSFDFSNEVKKNFEQKIIDAKLKLYQKDKLQEYKEKFPHDYKLLKSMIEEKCFGKIVDKLAKLNIVSNAPTRDLNHTILQLVNGLLPNLIGGSADVATSTKMFVEHTDAMSPKNYATKFLHYGVREHAMAGISNGLALYGGLVPYQSCFLTFSDYLKPAIRMSALMNLRVFSVFSHDSITAGQDGPTHQPIEQLPNLRMIPNTIVSRPYNASEILATYAWFFENHKPCCMLVSKDKDNNVVDSDFERAIKGGYVLKDCRKASITLVSTGGDISRIINASEILKQKNIVCRIVSMPCISIFENQTNAYKKSVLKDLPTVYVETTADNVWYKFAHQNDLVLNLNTFGASGSPDQVLKFLKFDAESLAVEIEKWYISSQKQSD